MNESEINLDNLPLAEALSFADEGSTTGGLLTHAALKTLAAGCRELTAARAEIEAVTDQRDGLKQAVDCASDLLASVTEQRDEARRLAEKYRKSPIEVELDMIRGKIAIPDRAEFDCIAQIKAITDQRDGLRSCIDYVSDQLHKVTEQRDEEREIYGKSYSAELARSNHYKQQRDRLAEAMRQMWPFIEEDNYQNCNTPAFNAAILKYNEALKSLTPNVKDL